MLVSCACSLGAAKAYQIYMDRKNKPKEGNGESTTISKLPDGGNVIVTGTYIPNPEKYKVLVPQYLAQVHPQSTNNMYNPEGNKNL